MYDRLTFASAATAWLLAWLPAPAALAADPCDAAPTPECIIEEAEKIGRTGDEELHVWSQVEVGSALRRLGSPERARDHFDRAFALWDEIYRRTGALPGNSKRIARTLASWGDPRGAIIFDEMAAEIFAYHGPWPYDTPAPMFPKKAREEYLGIELHLLAWARSEAGDIEGALRTAALAPNEIIEANLLVAVAGDLAREKHMAGASEALARFQQVWGVRSGSAEWTEFDRAALIKALAWLNRREDALRYVDELGDVKERDEAYLSISDIYAKRGEFKTAQEIAELIQDDKEREYAIWGVAFRSAQAGETAEVKKLLSRLTILDDFDLIYDAMAATQAVEGDIDGALHFVEDHYQNSDRPYLLGSALDTIVRRLMEAGDIDGVEDAVEHLDADTKGELVRELAAVRAEAGRTEDALITARGEWSRRNRFRL